MSKAPLIFIFVFSLMAGQVFAADHFFLYDNKVVRATDQDIVNGKVLPDGNTIKFRQPRQGEFGIVKDLVVVVSKGGKIIKQGKEESNCRCLDSPTYVLWDTDRGPFPDKRVMKACWEASPHRKKQSTLDIYKELDKAEAQKYMQQEYMQRLLGK